MEKTLLQRLRPHYRLKIEETITDQPVHDFILKDLESSTSISFLSFLTVGYLAHKLELESISFKNLYNLFYYDR
jgi:hypothetical protein